MDVKARPLPVQALSDDWATLEALLPPQWQAKARELGAFMRGRVIADTPTLLRVMLIHLMQGCGLRQTADLARLGGIASVSCVAILKRLRNCGDWFEGMCREMRALWLAAPLRPPLASCWSDWRIRLVDGSMVSEPGVTGSQWRLHYSIDLPSLRADQVIVSSRKEGETLKRFTFKPAEIVVADRGFASPPGVAHVHQAGAAVVVRMNLVTLPLWGEDGQRLEVLGCVRALQKGQCAAWPARVKQGGQSIAGRLCAVRKNHAASQKGRDRVR